MTSEAAARALGAGSPREFTINGKKLHPKPLNLKQITELQRECVSVWRGNYLKSLKASLDVVFDDPLEGKQYLLKKAEDSAGWDTDDLPVRQVFDTGKIELTPELESWARNNIEGWNSNSDDIIKRRFLAFALDSEQLTEEEFNDRSTKPVRKITTSYVNWWVGGSPDGMLAMIWHMIQGDDFCTRQELEDALKENHAVLTDMAREIEHVTVPAVVGNGADSIQTEEKTTAESSP